MILEFTEQNSIESGDLQYYGGRVAAPLAGMLLQNIFNYIDLTEFNSPFKDVHTRKQRSAKHVSPLAKEGDDNSNGELSF